MTLPLGVALPAMADDNQATPPALLPTDGAPTPAGDDRLPEDEGRVTNPAFEPELGELEWLEGESEEADFPLDSEGVDGVPLPESKEVAGEEFMGLNEEGLEGELEVAYEETSQLSATTSAAPNTATRHHNFFLNDRWTGVANMDFAWGDASYEVLVGDWDGDGKDTIALRKGNQFAFSNTNPASGTPQFTLTLGAPSDTFLVGDWDGDGKDTISVRRGSTFYVKNTLVGSTFTSTFSYGKTSDEVFVGDWDGNGTDTLALRRGNEFHISNKNGGGKVDRVVNFGRAGDDLYVGSFDRSRPGLDSFAVRRGNTYFISKAIKSGNADIQLDYGRVNDVTLLGDWNGDGEDTLGVVRTVVATASIKPAPIAAKKPTGAQVLAYALKHDGAPYAKRGVTPTGWDCIGMIRYVYKNFGVEIGGRPSAVLDAGRKVPYSKAQPGDILYWEKSNTMRGAADHVAIYVDANTNFAAWNSTTGTHTGKTRWRNEPPTVIRVFG